MLDPELRERLRAAALDFLTGELPRLEAAGLLPRPWRESPWIDRQRLWSALERDVGTGLADALEKALPDRWAGSLKYPGAREYVEALLRGVVAAATLEGELPHAFGGTAALVEEFLNHLANPAQPVRLLRLLADLDVSAADARSVHGVRLTDVRGLMETLSQEMKEAASEVRHLPVALGSREPRAFLVSEREKAGDTWPTAFDLRPHLTHVTTALRLVTAGTIIEPLEVYGQPTMVHVGGPSATALDPDHSSYWRRVGVVRPEHLAALDAVATLVCDLDRLPPDKPAPLAMAIGRFNRSHRTAAWPDVVIDIAVGLEAALSTGDKEEVTLRVRSRAAHLLARPSDPPGEIFDAVGELLTIRGKVAHGTVVPPKLWTKMFEQRGLDQVFVADRLHVLFDRWRDLLRRAILARLFLVDADQPEPWTLRGSPPVDRILVGSAGRRQWRGFVRRRAIALGIPAVIDRPEPLRDFLHHPYGEALDH